MIRSAPRVILEYFGVWRALRLNTVFPGHGCGPVMLNLAAWKDGVSVEIVYFELQSVTFCVAWSRDARLVGGVWCQGKREGHHPPSPSISIPGLVRL